jgi:uncharacterized protein YehS (DUF1456 family)
MNNNEFFKYLLHLTGLGLNKELLRQIFKLGGAEPPSESHIKAWRTSLDNNRASPMPDKMLNYFLQGLFKYRDLKKAEGIQVFNFGIDK